jgi:predicted amidohydrolase
MKASFQDSFQNIVNLTPAELWLNYNTVFSALAREFGVTIVAPGAYLPDTADGVIRALAAVYGPGGELLGTQAKVMLSKADQVFAQPGTTWDIIRTEVGALGIMIGSDVLYPEVGRLLAFQGAEGLVSVAAANSPAQYNKIRAGALARMQDNQLYAALAFAIGANPFARDDEALLQGKSAIFAPQELTPRFKGVLVEMGNTTSEGVITAEWDYVALRELWDKGETPLRRTLAGAQASKMLASIYERLYSVPRLSDGSPAEQQQPNGLGAAAGAATPMIPLDDLPVIASITSRWPLARLENDDPAGQESIVEWNTPVAGPATTLRVDEPITAHEDETDEMDALAGS